MKKTLAITGMLFGLAAGQVFIPVSTAQATQTASTTTTTTASAEQNWLDRLNTRIDLAQVKVAALRAQIALDIEKSPERARRALDDALTALRKAKDTASEAVNKQINALHKDIRAAQDAIVSAPTEARNMVNDVVKATDDRIEEYGQIAADTDEAKLLKKRYAQLQAQAALLKAQLAEKADKTGEQAKSYHDKAKAWYTKAKTNASKKWHDTLNATSDHIDAAKQTVKNKRDQAGEAISKLAKRAADLVRSEKAEEPAN